jgi:hypothetical protein
MKKFYLFLAVLLAGFGCKKSELEQITNNEPPPDETISTVTIENYITRTYILVLGREPDSIEYTNAHDLLVSARLDSGSRRKFVDTVFADPDYRTNVYNENRIDLLNNIDTVEFGNWIYIFQLLLGDTTYQAQWPLWQYEMDRMVNMRNAYNEFVGNLIQVDELHRRMCNNYFYDQLNMGSANFVISTFQHLINRNPTASEQQSGISMVDGHNATLFLQSGNSKDDYLNIFTSSNSYYEGQVIFFYLKYLNRSPGSVEMSDGASLYSSSGDYTVVQKIILTSDEFIGI